MKIVVMVVVIIWCNSFANAQIDVLVDPRDGKEYKIAVIGSQVWMAENLKYAPTIAKLYSTHYYEHSRISFRGSKDYEVHPTSDVAAIYCYNDDSIVIARYGMLYTWNAAKDACPVGWHLPSEQEFEKLFLTIGGGDKEKAKQSLVIGGSSGFEATFCGCLFANFDGNNNDISKFDAMGGVMSYWSSTERTKRKAKAILIEKEKAMIGSDFHIENYYKGMGFSVRCIKD